MGSLNFNTKMGSSSMCLISTRIISVSSWGTSSPHAFKLHLKITVSQGEKRVALTLGCQHPAASRLETAQEPTVQVAQEGATSIEHPQIKPLAFSCLCPLGRKGRCCPPLQNPLQLASSTSPWCVAINLGGHDLTKDLGTALRRSMANIQ